MSGEGAGRAVQQPPHPYGVGEGPGKLNGIIDWNHFYTFSCRSWRAETRSILVPLGT